MRSSSESRQHWRDRQLAATDTNQRPQQRQRQHRVVQPSDIQDAFSPAPAWAAAWYRIHDLGLVRQCTNL